MVMDMLTHEDRQKYKIERREGMRDDYTIDQNWDDYTAEDHAIWRELYDTQAALLPGLACKDYMNGLDALDISNGIPNFEDLNAKLKAKTGFTIVAVPGAVPASVFFEHLANRRFPSTEWIRTRDQFDYIREPDVFHDIFGHVPLLANPVFADYMEAYGKGGMRSLEFKASKKLGRLYWYTVEFGLINTAEGLRIYGAGILSSQTESVYALESAIPRRIQFDLKRIMQTDFDITNLQKLYFVINDFQELMDATAGTDFTPIYTELAGKPIHAPEDKADGDLVV